MPSRRGYSPVFRGPFCVWNHRPDHGARSRPRGSIRLRGREEYRIRVGDYRVLYIVDDVVRLVEILAVRHRRDVYRPGS